MKKSYSFLGSISEGRLILHNEKLFKERMRKLKEVGLIELTVIPYFDKRTNKQNALYWGAIVSSIRQEVEETSGEVQSLEEIHEFLKGRFCFKEMYSPDKEEYYNLLQETKKLSTGEFHNYVEKCKQFALNFFGLDIEKIIREYEKEWKTNT